MMNHSTVTQNTVMGTTIRYKGASYIDGSKLNPYMGYIAGHLKDSNILYVGKDDACELDTGNLSSSYNYGTFNSHNQKQNCGKGPWGVYGNSSGKCTIL